MFVGVLPVAMASVGTAASHPFVLSRWCFVAFGCYPFFLCKAPAQVSTSCDKLMDQLNRLLLCDGCQDRAFWLRTYLVSQNNAGPDNQGLGFKLLGTVINTRYLAKVSTACASSIFTLAVILVDFGVAHKTEMAKLNDLEVTLNGTI